MGVERELPYERLTDVFYGRSFARDKKGRMYLDIDQTYEQNVDRIKVYAETLGLRPEVVMAVFLDILFEEENLPENQAFFESMGLHVPQSTSKKKKGRPRIVKKKAKTAGNGKANGKHLTEYEPQYDGILGRVYTTDTRETSEEGREQNALEGRIAEGLQKIS